MSSGLSLCLVRIQLYILIIKKSPRKLLVYIIPAAGLKKNNLLLYKVIILESEISIALAKYGKKWSEIQRNVQTRNIIQIRTHAQKFFLRLSRVIPEGMDAIEFMRNKPAQSFLSFVKEWEEVDLDEGSHHSNVEMVEDEGIAFSTYNIDGNIEKDFESSEKDSRREKIKDKYGDNQYYEDEKSKKLDPDYENDFGHSEKLDRKSFNGRDRNSGSGKQSNSKSIHIAAESNSKYKEDHRIGKRQMYFSDKLLSEINKQ